MTDEKIVELYFLKSEDAIKETSIKYRKMCMGISMNILGNYEDAEECTSDAYLKVWNVVPPQKPQCLSAFLAKIVRNISLNKLKHEKRQKYGKKEAWIALDELELVLPSSENTEDTLNAEELKAAINTFVAQLPNDTRRVFVGRYWFFDSIADIAKKTGFSQSKVKMTLFRTRDSLKKYLEKEGLLYE